MEKDLNVFVYFYKKHVSLVQLKKKEYNLNEIFNASLEQKQIEIKDIDNLFKINETKIMIETNMQTIQLDHYLRREPEKNCPICLESLFDKHFIITHCGHYFHSQCILDAFNHLSIFKIKCPLCNYSHPFYETTNQTPKKVIVQIHGLLWVPKYKKNKAKLYNVTLNANLIKFDNDQYILIFENSQSFSKLTGFGTTLSRFLYIIQKRNNILTLFTSDVSDCSLILSTYNMELQDEITSYQNYLSVIYLENENRVIIKGKCNCCCS